MNPTRREAQVIELREQRLSYSAIATRLKISPETVKIHVRNILRKGLCPRIRERTVAGRQS